VGRRTICCGYPSTEKLPMQAHGCFFLLLILLLILILIFPIFWKRIKIKRGQIGAEQNARVTDSRKVSMPGFGVALKMHHRNNQQVVTLHNINNSVGKAVSPATSDAVVQHEPCCRVDEHSSDGATNFLEKIKSQSWNSVFVIFRSAPQFLNCRPQKPKLHFFNSSSMVRNASSPSTVASWPARKAARRSCDSSSHARSMEICSAGSRLRQSVSIICALSDGGSFKASFARICLSMPII